MAQATQSNDEWEDIPLDGGGVSNQMAASGQDSEWEDVPLTNDSPIAQNIRGQAQGMLNESFPELGPQDQLIKKAMYNKLSNDELKMIFPELSTQIDGGYQIPLGNVIRKIKGLDPNAVPGYISAPFKVAGSVIGAVGEGLGRVSSAPLRAGITSAARGEGFIRGASEQFLRPTEEAPSGAEMLSALGVPESPLSDYIPESVQKQFPQLYKSGAFSAPLNEALGVPAELVVDPILIGGAVAGPLAKGAKALSGTKGLRTVAKGLGKASTRILEALSGVPEQEINTLINKGDEVADIIKKFGSNIPEAADVARESMQAQIQSVRRNLNATISGALKNETDAVGNISDVLKKLKNGAESVNKTLNPEQYDAIMAMHDKVKSLADGAGNTTLANIFDIKQYLQENSTFMTGKDIFPKGSAPSRVAKEASRLARLRLNDLSPEISKANNMLSRLHDVESKINKNIIAPGRPEGALLSAGAGQNRNRLMLQRLSEIIGKDLVAEADKLATARRFAAPSLTAVENTGKDISRFARGTAIGVGIGGLVGGVPGAAIGATIGSSLTSPFAVRGAVGAARLTKKHSTETGFKRLLQGAAAARAKSIEDKKSKEKK